MLVIEVKNLVKRYKDVEAVKGISFQVEEGEIFGFLSPNGAGKSTVINILSTLLKPTSCYVFNILFPFFFWHFDCFKDGNHAGFSADNEFFGYAHVFSERSHFPPYRPSLLGWIF